MNGFKGVGETLLFISGIGVVLLILFISLVVSFYKIFSKKEDKKERAKKIAIKSMKRIFFSVIIGFFCNYFYGAYLRSKAYDCTLEESISYIAELCRAGTNIEQDRMRLRIYSAREKILLAERTFLTSDTPRKLIWNREWLIYNSDDQNNSIVTLPPAWRDRLLAKFP
ncbi:hypothetical protein [Collimonas silvisoli]|uniref:hypothetical protein n=1 Tax=Collimonas silvisoli TaxID=2825884 RepID=UPI001B8CA2E9|nr:hypothetical protein [Collimonas silvisoli]